MNVRNARLNCYDNSDKNGKTGNNPQNSRQKLSVQHREREGGDVPACRTGGEQLPRADKTTEYQELERPGLPVDDRAEIRHRERRNAAEPGGGRRRPPTARKNRHGNRCVSERPEKVTGRRPPQTEGREGGGEKGGNRPERHAPFEKRSFTYKNLPA